MLTHSFGRDVLLLEVGLGAFLPVEKLLKGRVSDESVVAANIFIDGLLSVRHILSSLHTHLPKVSGLRRTETKN